MPNAINWEAALSAGATEIMTSGMDSLADNTISAASTAVANNTNLDMLYSLELNVTFGTAPDDDEPSVDVYIAKAPDGTNYESAPLTGGAQQGHMYAGSFPVRKVTSAQRVVIGPLPLPPCPVKFYLDNQSGQAMASSGNTLDIYVTNPEIQ